MPMVEFNHAWMVCLGNMEVGYLALMIEFNYKLQKIFSVTIHTY